MPLATPLQYLNRWRIHNLLFKDDVELVGMSPLRSEWRIVISQKAIIGEDAELDEIERYFVSAMGFKRINPPGLEVLCNDPYSRAYLGGRFAVFDVRPPNCVRTEDGEMVPVDVIPILCTQEEAFYLAGFAMDREEV